MRRNASPTKGKTLVFWEGFPLNIRLCLSQQLYIFYEKRGYVGFHKATTTTNYNKKNNNNHSNLARHKALTFL